MKKRFAIVIFLLIIILGFLLSCREKADKSINCEVILLPGNTYIKGTKAKISISIKSKQELMGFTVSGVKLTGQLDSAFYTDVYEYYDTIAYEIPTTLPAFSSTDLTFDIKGVESSVKKIVNITVGRDATPMMDEFTGGRIYNNLGKGKPAWDFINNIALDSTDNIQIAHLINITSPNSSSSDLEYPYNFLAGWAALQNIKFVKVSSDIAIQTYSQGYLEKIIDIYNEGEKITELKHIKANEVFITNINKIYIAVKIAKVELIQYGPSLNEDYIDFTYKKAQTEK